MGIYDVFMLLGGLAMFLYGMHIMGESLERRAGSRLKLILEQLTSRPFKGVLLGAGVTAIVQSSSATTVMVVGFVNSGIMQLRQAIGVVMGANIGTTITAWVLSLSGIRGDNFWVTLLKPSSFSPLLGFAGIIMLLASRRHKDTAGIMLGFAVLMFGMEQMSDSVSGLAHDPAFTNLLIMFSNPVFGVLVGAFVTAVIQSSSASVGILQAIANTGVLNFGSALPIIMGQNIGTCITAIISSIGANRNAKRVAAVHLIFNLLGTAVLLTVFYAVNSVARFSFMEGRVSALGIAIVHTTFNLLTTALLFPFAGWLESLSRRLIHDGKGDSVVMLDERLLATPSIAIEQCRRIIGEMAVHSKEALMRADELLDEFNPRVFDLVQELESRVDVIEDRLGTYLVKVSQEHLSQRESREVSKFLHIIGDLERISDHAVNLGESAQEVFNKGVRFSPEAQGDVKVIRRAVKDILNLAIEALVTNDLDIAEKVEPMEEVVDRLRDGIKAGHIRRLQRGECTLELGFTLSDILTNLERVSDHCSNIATCLIEIGRHGSVDAHEYTRTLREGESGARFEAMFHEYADQYSLVSSGEEAQEEAQEEEQVKA